MYVLNQWESLLCKEIVDCAFLVHKELGPGLLEKIYETCFSYELTKKGIYHERQVSIPVKYKEITLDEVLKVDILVEHQIICELKAVEIVNPIWQAQILSQLQLSRNHIGFRINFNVEVIKEGIRRYCL